MEIRIGQNFVSVPPEKRGAGFGGFAVYSRHHMTSSNPD